MDRYIGADAHASSCTLAVLSPSGKRLGSHVVETNASALIEVIRTIPGPRHLCLEEGTLAGWLHEVLAPHVQTLVVAAVSESRGQKSDQQDAFGLAESPRVGCRSTERCTQSPCGRGARVATSPSSVSARSRALLPEPCL